MADPVSAAAAAPARAPAPAPVPLSDVPTLASPSPASFTDNPIREGSASNGAGHEREAAVDGDRWHELRDLLVDPERVRIEALERTLANPLLHVEEITEALPEAITRASAIDNRLGVALAPVLGEAIKAAVRRDPQPLVDAIFPVMGPAIRRAISNALAELVQSLNTTLEHTLSLKGLSWRWEAMRSGKSFGEVVLSHSLLYRVEQLFLIHRESGLLMEHLTAPNVLAPSPDMVASMMTALRDFARDSFRASESESLDSLKMGELTVWAESGPAAVLAAVIRGEPPLSYREDLQRTLEDVHRAHAEQIERFGATGVAFPVSLGLLERSLVTQRQVLSRRGSGWRMWLMGAVVLAAVGWCAVPRAMEQRRFNNFVEQVRREPGVVLGSVGRQNGRFVVTGLRDPLARDPAEILRANDVASERVDAKWEPYVALRPEFTLRRATALLNPPPTAKLTLVGDTLTATGIASAAWRSESEKLARAIPGVGVVSFGAVADSAGVALRERADELQAASIKFPIGSASILAGQTPQLDTLASNLLELIGKARTARLFPTILLLGSADSLGTEVVNAVLRRSRGVSVQRELKARGVPTTMLRASSDTVAGAQTSRRVRLSISFSSLDSLRPQP